MGECKCECCNKMSEHTFTCEICYKEVCFDCFYFFLGVCPECLNEEEE